MPFFATGIHFSPTGDFLEGQENPMFLSSLGEFVPGFPLAVTNNPLTLTYV